MRYDLSGYKILVTGGSTWVSIDTVRVITNIFKGKIGFTVAKMAAEMGAEVTLLLGESLDISKYEVHKNLHIHRFKFFDDLDLLMEQKLKEQKFDAVVHSAAVSDFKLANIYNGKIKSDSPKVIIELIPTKKIVDYIKERLPSTFLVKFKLEVNVSVTQLKDIAYKSLKQSKADLIVANIYNSDFSSNGHEAYIMDINNSFDKVTGREVISEAILKKIYDKK